MNNNLFTVEGALDFANKGKIEDWVHLFLNSIGDNKPFSEGLRLQKRYWLGPILVNLDFLTRTCGPELEMPYVVSQESWDNHISRFEKLIKQNWELPPLIVQLIDNKLIINDGNHRYEALKNLGYEKFWVIIWDSENQIRNNKRINNLLN